MSESAPYYDDHNPISHMFSSPYQRKNEFSKDNLYKSPNPHAIVEQPSTGFSSAQKEIISPQKKEINEISIFKKIISK